ncbi:hypothetical protein BKA56DRAFT_589777 [Ilyonectria sp. MPI-CAGE-AT-0026]|nr:hypothetical protein BKA56DRAFT_589777 [Ilyonectria sp. MPI-CAGE-AT-0026]
MKASIEAAAKKAEQLPIRFKDAVGRKFSFPFHLCGTWQGMEDLIKQAFLQVDVLGPHVQEGHYDLIGPDGEIILPSVWEKVVQPDWAITMTMWPMDKLPPVSRMPPGWHGAGRGIPPDVINVGPPKGGKSSKKKQESRGSGWIGFLARKPPKKNSGEGQGGSGED